jgi:hypothetical protein
MSEELCPSSGACLDRAQASSSPEPGTDLGRLSVGSAGGREKLAHEQSSKKIMARKLYAEIDVTLTTIPYAPNLLLDVQANEPAWLTSRSLELERRHTGVRMFSNFPPHAVILIFA